MKYSELLPGDVIFYPGWKERFNVTSSQIGHDVILSVCLGKNFEIKIYVMYTNPQKQSSVKKWFTRSDEIIESDRTVHRKGVLIH